MRVILNLLLSAALKNIVVLCVHAEDTNTELPDQGLATNLFGEATDKSDSSLLHEGLATNTNLFGDATDKSDSKTKKKNSTKSKKRKRSKNQLPIEQHELTITTPDQSFTIVEQRVVDIKGKITPYASGIVKAVGFGVITTSTTILSSGLFSLENVYLPEGETDVLVSAVADDGSAIGKARTLRFSYTRPYEGSSFVTSQDGGGVEIMDQDSPVAGAKFEVPPGSAKRDVRIQVLYDPEHVPLVPFRYVAVGPPVRFGPEAETFNGFVSLSIPINPVLIPDSLDSTYAKVLSLTEDGWKELVNQASVSAENRLTFDVNSLDSMAFVSVVDVPLQFDQVIIETHPAAARLYVDGVASGTSPAVVHALSSGEHTARIYLPGYNELYFSFETPPQGQGVVINKVLEYATEPQPNVLLEGNLDGLKTSSSFVEIVADVTFEDNKLDEGIGILSINGKETIQTVNDGQIKGFVSLDEGYNHVEVRVIGPNGNTGVSRPAIITRETPQVSRRFLRLGETTRRHLELNANNEIKIVLSWNTVYTDIDVHVFDPLGNHAWYGSQKGIPGAAIDVDDTDGYGPEIFSYLSPVPGTYRVAVDAYLINESPTTASLEISVGGKIVFSGSYLFTESDSNNSNGKPVGANPNAFWDAFTFQVGSLVITSVRTHQESVSNQHAIFTTNEGENEIFITTFAPDDINDSDIMYEIEEVVEGFTVLSPSTVGRSTSFLARHEPLTSLTEPVSHALEFRVVAYTLKNGERQESAPIFIRQDWSSQIRQEYVDKQEFEPTFVQQVPPRSQIISESQFNRRSPYFTFEELSQFSDYYVPSGLSVIGNSAAIANTLREAWGYPLFCTSGWRNPRRNDKLVGSVINSFHQQGNAVDLDPSQYPSKWPSNVLGCAEVTSYETAQAALTCLARQIFDTSKYDIDFHANHLHIEQHTSGDADGNEKYGVDQSTELNLVIGDLTILGEGIISHIYWPETSSSGVTLGIGYDVGSRSVADVKAQLMAAGMVEEQAALISNGAGLKGRDAMLWVGDNKAVVGALDEAVIRRLFAQQLPQYTQQAKALATDTNPSPGQEKINARSRELVEDKPLFTYVMTEEQWNGLHPAMHELITDLKFQGGFYGYDRIAKINAVLIENDGDHLEQFKQVARLFVAPENGNGYSYMDTYAIAVGLQPGNTETFYGIKADALRGSTERRGRVRLSFINSVINALERGASVAMKPPAEPVITGCMTKNPHEAATCVPGPNGCYTPRAVFVRNSIMSCFQGQKAPTTYHSHSGAGNSMDAWPKGGGYRIKADGVLKNEMDNLADWLMVNAEDLKLYYMIFYNRIWNPSRDRFGVWWDCNTPLPGTDPPQYRCGCKKEGTCEDVTQGHFDHLHLTVLY